jgi:hypothetical protein
MKTVSIISTVALMMLLLVACSRRHDSNQVSKEIIVGGLYASKSDDGTFQVSKVLAVDNDAVHVRIYRNKFQSLPQELDTSSLSLGKIGDPDGFGIGHAPIAKQGWLDSRIFLKKEPVRDDELEGYKYYLEEMKK